VSCWAALDIGLIVDSSYDGVTKSQAKLPDGIMAFLQQLVGSLRIDKGQADFGLVQFDQRSVFSFGFKTYLDTASLVQKIGTLIPTGQKRNFSSALNGAVSLFEGARANSQKIIVFITDGRPDDDINATLSVAASLKASGVEVYTVGISSSVSERHLMLTCSCQAQQLFHLYTQY